MEDEFEENLTYSKLITYFRIISSFILSASPNSPLALMANIIFRVEFVFLFVVLLAILYTKRPENVYELLSLKFRTIFYSFSKAENCLASALDKSALTHWELHEQNVSAYGIKGLRPKMEDRFTVLYDEKEEIYIYGIFDGHGGEFAAEFAKTELFPQLMARLKQASQEDLNNGTKLSDIISQEIVKVDDLLLEKLKAKRDISGTTALVAVLLGGSKQLLVANVGDSRGVLCDNKGTTIAASYDHKPQQTKEQRRIEKAGGTVTWTGVWRVAGVLATSRAMGDYPLKSPRPLVVAEPDILSFPLEDLKFLILATDGLWDVFSNEAAVEYIRSRLSLPDKGTAGLAHSALKRGSPDNISIMVVDLSR